MTPEQLLYNAVMNERERIKAIIRKHEEAAIDLAAKMMEEAGDEKERAVLFGSAMFLIQTLEPIEQQIDKHGKSRITIGEMSGIR